MKISINRSSIGFWMLYFLMHFSILLVVLVFFRWLWIMIVQPTYTLDFAEMAFESACYSLIVSIFKYISYYIGKKRYEKNPVDRRKNNMFRE
ncbi:MAG: hypothetical protein MJ071_03600 [Oscillospiraceae bacterium]|nr:hypothetical protein [Oscillospiraceae bacterium]